jgi:hypothetical protein
MSDMKERSALAGHLEELAKAGETTSLSGISALSTLALSDLGRSSLHSATMLAEVSSTLKGVGPDGKPRPMTMRTVLDPDSIAGLHNVLMASLQPQITNLVNDLRKLQQDLGEAYQTLERKIVAFEVVQLNFDRQIRAYVDQVRDELLTIIDRECGEHCRNLEGHLTKLQKDVQEHDRRFDELRRELGNRIDRECGDKTRQPDAYAALHAVAGELGNLVRQLGRGGTGTAGRGQRQTPSS